MTRRLSRECALQILFRLDANPGAAGSVDFTDFTDFIDSCTQEFWREFEVPPRVDRAHAETLVVGVMTHRDVIDAAIVAACDNWRLERMDLVDRNVLRLCAFELLFQPDVPAAVAINEAIEISKRFGGPESAPFVNGILDRLHRDHSAT